MATPMATPTEWGHMSAEQTPTIKDFLLARIAEDEDGARAAAREVHIGNAPVMEWEWAYFMVDEGGPSDAAERHVTKWWPARVLAECAAKRSIIGASHWELQSRPTDTELHSRALHPAYEYKTTEGPRKQWDYPDEPPAGEGWERNMDIGYGQGWARLDYTEESYWRRLKPESERREWEQYIPLELRALAAVYSDHRDYRQEWAA